MERIILDMDNVMAAVNPQYVKFYKKIYNKDLNLKELETHQINKTYPDYKELHYLLEQPGFFRTMEPMVDSPEVVNAINEKYELFIVSAAMTYPLSLNEKLDWLKEYFPFITPKQIAFVGSKVFTFGDYMIDDKVSNLDHFNGKKILYSHPNNINIENPNYIRVHNWKEIANILL
ncbi:5' nucleotidase, NT5C type [Rhizosphaericola mali]|uniref:5'(3')-deoxyribonucleotidase n=1 Tax=Rhizosphaericola mali TaxID=2545455 RepID=A0A5P2G5I1_9BACT|nr:5'(3')-deoxyribonucleotidase [Rhizosphaericola mali]QES89010.1 5'(3')-deoxyribonucleotidase [Rhizosphaericola mali]